MAKQKSTFQCSECGWTTVRWVGKCAECQAWGSVAQVVASSGAPSKAPASPAVPIVDVPLAATTRQLTGISELDRVLGGGLVPGIVALLAGEPGVGKSTLLLDVAAKWARQDRKTLYVSGEESAAQIRLRAERTDAVAANLWLAAEDDLATVLGHIEAVGPSLLVLDSVQTIRAEGAEGTLGGVAQVKEVTSALVRVAKRRQMAVMIVGHVTKDGAIAGPRTLEHLVDVVLNFEGDKHSGFRLVRAVKNRFGPADEVGCFEMVDNGIAEVGDPSNLFLSQLIDPVPGTAVTVSMEGRRPLVAEVQALTPPTAYSQPKRTTHGVDGSRVAMILAVLQQRLNLTIAMQDVYVSTVGGVRLVDPSADLAIALAVASASQETVRDHRVIALGEIGLSGELRSVANLSRRLAEAARLGFSHAIVPTRGEAALPPGMKVARVDSLCDAMHANSSVH